MSRAGRAAAGVLGLGLLLGCSSGAAPPPQTPTPSRTPTGQPPLAVVAGSVGGVPLRLEVARTQAQQEAGLRDREVPRGAGMAFPYPGGRVVRFTMSGVERPLTGVFARSGRVLRVERMAPCGGAVDACPLYGPDEPVDVVVETAPETLPQAAAGDAVVVPAG